MAYKTRLALNTKYNMMQNTMANQQVTPQEQKQIVQIVRAFLMKQPGATKDSVENMFTQLAQRLKQPGAKLVHFGDSVFLVMVTDQGSVEVHNLSIIKNFGGYMKNFEKLIKYLKAIGTRTITTSSDDARFKTGLKKLGITNTAAPSDQGTNYTLELA